MKTSHILWAPTLAARNFETLGRFVMLHLGVLVELIPLCSMKIGSQYVQHGSSLFELMLSCFLGAHAFGWFIHPIHLSIFGDGNVACCPLCILDPNLFESSCGPSWLLFTKPFTGARQICFTSPPFSRSSSGSAIWRLESGPLVKIVQWQLDYVEEKRGRCVFQPHLCAHSHVLVGSMWFEWGETAGNSHGFGHVLDVFFRGNGIDLMGCRPLKV